MPSIITAPLVYPVSSPPIRNGAILVENDTIQAVGLYSDIKTQYPQAKESVFEQCCLIPGLINAHTHLDLSQFPMSYFSDEEEGLLGMAKSKVDFVSWVLGVIKYRKEVPQQSFVEAIQDGLDRSVRSGTTCLGEISTIEGEFSIVEKSGLRMVVFPEMISYDGEQAHNQLEEIQTLVERYHDFNNPIMSVGISPHAPHTVSRPLLKILQDYAREENLPVQIHAGESFQEMEFFFDAGGDIADKLFPQVGWGEMKPPCVRKTPIEYLDSIGFLQCAPSIIHGVQVADRDLDRMKAAGANLITCPRSNYFLQVGQTPLNRYRERGIPIGIGTDSLASNTTLSVWDEMRFLWAQTKLPKSLSSNFSAVDILQMATLGGAQCLRIEEKTGSLEEGKMADIIAVRYKDESQVSDQAETLSSYLIQQTEDADIQMVMVAGKELSLEGLPVQPTESTETPQNA